MTPTKSLEIDFQPDFCSSLSKSGLLHYILSRKGEKVGLFRQWRLILVSNLFEFGHTPSPLYAGSRDPSPNCISWPGPCMSTIDMINVSNNNIWKNWKKFVLSNRLILYLIITQRLVLAITSSEVHVTNCSSLRSTSTPFCA